MNYENFLKVKEQFESLVSDGEEIKELSNVDNEIGFEYGAIIWKHDGNKKISIHIAYSKTANVRIASEVCVGNNPKEICLTMKSFMEIFDSFKEQKFCMPDEVNTKKEYEQYLKDIGFTKIGLYATDKEIGDLLYLFWQRSSDACPLECSEAEKQEKKFSEWVKTVSWRIS